MLIAVQLSIYRLLRVEEEGTRGEEGGGHGREVVKEERVEVDIGVMQERQSVYSSVIRQTATEHHLVNPD